MKWAPGGIAAGPALPTHLSSSSVKLLQRTSVPVQANFLTSKQHFHCWSSIQTPVSYYSKPLSFQPHRFLDRKLGCSFCLWLMLLAPNCPVNWWQWSINHFFSNFNVHTDSDSASLGRVLKACISIKFPSDASVADTLSTKGVVTKQYLSICVLQQISCTSCLTLGTLLNLSLFSKQRR